MRHEGPSPSMLWVEREREEFEVWADSLQAKGQRLGELISTSLQLERCQATEGESELGKLRRAVTELEREVLEPINGPLLERWPQLQPYWRHGMLVALRIDPAPPHEDSRQRGYELETALAELLGHPNAHMFRHLHVDTGQGPTRRAAVNAMTRGLVRPWTIVLGTPPTSPDLVELDEFGRWKTKIELLLRRQPRLRNLFDDGVRARLNWHPGDPETRRKAALTLVQHEPLDEAETLTTLARALHDSDPQVRVTVLEQLPRLGGHAAAFVPDLLLLHHHPGEWNARVAKQLEAFAHEPELVRSLAATFTLDQPQCASWLGRCTLPEAREAIPRVEAMLHGWRPVSTLQRARIEDTLARLRTG